MDHLYIRTYRTRPEVPYQIVSSKQVGWYSNHKTLEEAEEALAKLRSQ